MNDGPDINAEWRPTDNRPADHLPAIVVPAAVGPTTPLPAATLIPALIANEGERASWRYVEFFTVQYP